MGSEKAELVETERRVVVTRDWGAGEGLPWWLSGKESTCYAGAAGDVGLIPGSGRCLEGGHGTHSIILAWRIPWTEEPGKLQSMGSQRVRHDSATNTGLILSC